MEEYLLLMVSPKVTGTAKGAKTAKTLAFLGVLRELRGSKN